MIYFFKISYVRHLLYKVIRRVVSLITTSPPSPIGLTTEGEEGLVLIRLGVWLSSVFQVPFT